MSKIAQSLSTLCEHLIVVILHLLAFFIPLIFSRVTKQNFLLTKETWLTAAVIVLLALWLIRHILLMRRDTFRSPLNLALLVYLAANLLSFHGTVNLAYSFKGLIKVLNYLVLYLVASTTLKKTRHMHNIVFLMVFTGGLVALYGALQYHGIDPFFDPADVRGATGRSQIFSTFGNPTFLADYLVITFWLSFFNVIVRYKKAVALQEIGTVGYINGFLSGRIEARDFLRGIFELWAFWFSGFAAAVTVYTIFLTRTRGAWLAIAATIPVSMMIMVFFHWNYVKKILVSTWFRRTVIAVMACMALFLVIIEYTGDAPEFFDIFQDRFIRRFTNLNTVYQRFLNWIVTWNMAMDRPWFGHGLFTYQVIYPSYQADFLDMPGRRVQYGNYAVCYRHTHNEYLQAAAELGLVGMAAFTGMFLVFFYMSGKIMMEEHAAGNITNFYHYFGFTSAIAAVMIQSVFNFPFHRCAPQVAVFMIMAFVTIRYAGRFDDDNIKDKADAEKPADGNDHISGSRKKRKRRRRDMGSSGNYGSLQYISDSDLIKAPVIILVIWLAYRGMEIPRRYFEGSKMLKAGYMLAISRHPDRDRANDFLHAINYLVQAIRKDPVDSESYYWLAFCYEELYNLRDSLRPEYIPHLLMQWGELVLEHRWDLTPGLKAQLPERMVPDGISPGDRFVRYPDNLEDFLELDILDLALGTLKQARYYTHNNLVFFRFGTTLTKKAQNAPPDKAAEYLEDARKNMEISQRMVPTFPDAFFNHAIIEVQLGNIDKATELFEWIIQTTPGFHLPYEHLTSIYVREAMRLQSEPVSDRAEHLRSLEYAARKIHFGASRLLQLGDGRIPASRQYGKPSRNQLRQAQSHLAAALQLLDNIAGEHYMDWKKDDRAESLRRAKILWRMCIGTDPGYANAYYNLGVIEYERNNYEAALEIWKEALEHSPDEGRFINSIRQVKHDMKREERGE